MHVSAETAEQTDARLRRVMAMATLDVDDRSWWFEELARSRTSSVGRGRMPSRSSATPTAGASSSRSARPTHRPSDSGSGPSIPERGGQQRLRRLARHPHQARNPGGGVFVVCGQNSRRGGIYDHWGCPEAVADQVLETIHALARRREDVRVSGGRAGSLHGLRMRVVSGADAGEVDAATTLAFEQAGSTVWARYGGGKVRMGFLLGDLSGSRLECRYVQMGTDGRIDSGHSTCTIDALPDGRVGMTQRFEWDTRTGSGMNVFEELSGPGPRADGPSSGSAIRPVS